MKQTESYQKVAQNSIGSIITATLSEAGHSAVVRLTAACTYLEADTNLAYIEIKKALDSTNWAKLAEEILLKHGITKKHDKEMLLSAFQNEKRNQLQYWKGFDSLVHETANLQPAGIEDLTQVVNVDKVADVYSSPELDTDVNAQLVILIQLWCPQMAPDMKRKFAKQIKKTLEMQKRLKG